MRLGFPVDFVASRLRAYDGVASVVGKPKSCHFGLSRALAYTVVKKGVGGDFILCDLSPPVSANRLLARGYRF
jgi:hypothetical protein